MAISTMSASLSSNYVTCNLWGIVGDPSNTGSAGSHITKQTCGLSFVPRRPGALSTTTGHIYRVTRLSALCSGQADAADRVELFFGVLYTAGGDLADGMPITVDDSMPRGLFIPLANNPLVPVCAATGGQDLQRLAVVSWPDSYKNRRNMTLTAYNSFTSKATSGTVGASRAHIVMAGINTG